MNQYLCVINIHGNLDVFITISIFLIQGKVENVDVIILSYCKDEKIYKMNLDCLDSLFQSESDFVFHVLILESNKVYSEDSMPYNKYHNVRVMIPDEPFNYNRFLNIGITQTINKFIAICNNDLLFKKSWFSEIYLASQITSGLSFCPRNPYSDETNSPVFDNIKRGYNVREEFVGWCYVVNRKIFDIIPLHDERFSFYYQDNDFVLTLRKYNVGHYLVPDSHVIHLEGKTSAITDGFSYDERVQQDKIIFYEKWGSYKTIRRKILVDDLILHPLKLGFISRYLY